MTLNKQNASAARRVSANNARAAQTNTQTQAIETKTTGKNTERNRRRRQKRKQRMALLGETNEEFNRYLQVSRVPNATRTGVEPNPADPRSTLRQGLGQTPNGSEWALKVLHPCGEHNTGVPKIPDGAAGNSVIMERRDEFNVEKPATLDSEIWTVVVLQLPTLTRSLYAVCGLPEDMTQDNIRTSIDEMASAEALGYQYPSWVKFGANSIHGTVLLMTELDKTLWGDRDVDNFVKLFKSVRRTYCGLTLDLDFNELTSKGRLISAQFQDVKELRSLHYTYGEEEALTDDNIDVFVLDHPPYVTAEMVQEDSKVRQAEAKTGDYSPQRMWQPVIPLVGSQSARPMIEPKDFIDAPVPSTAFSFPLTIWFEGWGVGVTRWEGLHGTSSVRVKRKEGLEFVVGASSPYGPFQTDGYSMDAKAQAVVKEFSRTEPHSYEADFNSKGKLIGNLVQGLGGVLGNLGIPFANGIGNLVGGLLPF